MSEEVPLGQQEVRDSRVRGVDDHSPDLAGPAVAGLNVLMPPDLDLSERDTVMGDDDALRKEWFHTRPGDRDRPQATGAQRVVGPAQSGGAVMGNSSLRCEELRLLCRVESNEVGLRSAQREVVRIGVDQADRNQPPRWWSWCGTTTRCVRRFATGSSTRRRRCPQVAIHASDHSSQHEGEHQLPVWG